MRKLLITACCVAAFAVGADTLVWRIATAKLVAGVERFAAQATRQGWVVNQGHDVCPCRLSGWPFQARLDVASPAITGGERLLPGGLAWSADHIVIFLSLRHPATLGLQVWGIERLRLSHAPNLIFSAARLVVELPLGGALKGEATLRASGITGGIAGSGHPQDVRVDALRLDVRADPEAPGQAGARGLGLRLDIAAKMIGLPDSRRWPLGGTVASAAGSFSIWSPPLPFWDAQSSPLGSDPRAQAEAWRDAGGTVRISDLDLQWGPLLLDASAALGLDARLQPAGEGSADVSGLPGTLDALADGDAITPGLAATFKAVLAPMQHVSLAAAPAGDAALRLPFLLRDNTLSVGQIPLIHLNDIAWRPPPAHLPAAP
jgi:hypothetical protein